MLIKTIRGFKPKWGENCFFAENSSIIGDVIFGDNCSVWFSSVIRGDVNKIRIGNNEQGSTDDGQSEAVL